MPGDNITIWMLGDADGNAPGGFAVLDARDFTVAERWEREADGSVHVRLLVPAPAEHADLERVGRPEHVPGGFNPADVAAGKYGRKLHSGIWSSVP